jgi:type VI secretion system secreted protein Hcp
MATRIFLKLGDIKGSSQDDKKHKDWMEVESFGYGVSNSVNSTEKAKGNPGGEACIHSDVSMNKVIDKTSTQLYAYCSTGKVFDKAEIECCEGGVPTESLVLSFSKIAWQYKSDAEQHWDQITNTGSLKKK